MPQSGRRPQHHSRLGRASSKSGHVRLPIFDPENILETLTDNGRLKDIPKQDGKSRSLKQKKPGRRFGAQAQEATSLILKVRLYEVDDR
jgi:hypothetical protein